MNAKIDAFIREIARCFPGATSDLVITRRTQRQQETARMSFEQKNMTGALFSERDRKTKDEDRDYSGTLVIEGREYWLSAWVRTSKNGKKYLSLKVKAKQPPATEGAGKAVNFNDEICFAPEWR